MPKETMEGLRKMFAMCVDDVLDVGIACVCLEYLSGISATF